MRPQLFTVLQALLLLALIFWITGLGFSIILQQHNQYFNWTKKTLHEVWKKSWQFIIGIAIGYFIAGYPLLSIR